MDKGILLLALKHPYYGSMAENLAVSLRRVTNLPIAIAGDQAGMSHMRHPHLFKRVINVSVDYYWHEGTYQAIKAKTHLYDLTPFKKTLFLDADMVWLNKSPDEIFHEFQDVNFTIKNTGNIDLEKSFQANYSHWTKDLHKIKEDHKLSGKYYSLSSEVIYFKRNKEVKKLFDTTKKLYKAMVPGTYLPFSGGIPDELLFSIAMNKLDMPPHLDGWIPSYWEDAEKRNAEPKEILENYYAYSIGGKMQMDFVRNFYNNVVKNAYKNSALVNPWLLDKHKMKNSWLPERTHI